MSSRSGGAKRKSASGGSGTTAGQVRSAAARLGQALTSEDRQALATTLDRLASYRDDYRPEDAKAGRDEAARIRNGDFTPLPRQAATKGEGTLGHGDRLKGDLARLDVYREMLTEVIMDRHYNNDAKMAANSLRSAIEKEYTARADRVQAQRPAYEAARARHAEHARSAADRAEYRQLAQSKPYESWKYNGRPAPEERPPRTSLTFKEGANAKERARIEASVAKQQQNDQATQNRYAARNDPGVRALRGVAHDLEIDMRHAEFAMKAEEQGTAAYRKASSAYRKAQASYAQALDKAQKAEADALARITGRSGRSAKPAGGTRTTAKASGTTTTGTPRVKASPADKATAAVANAWYNATKDPYRGRSQIGASVTAVSRYLMATQPTWTMEDSGRYRTVSVTTPDGRQHDVTSWANLRDLLQSYAPDSLDKLVAAARAQAAKPAA